MAPEIKLSKVPPDWEPTIFRNPRCLADWDEYMETASRIVGQFHDLFNQSYFYYEHPEELQKNTPRRFRKSYKVSVAYTEWGEPGKPVILCFGGVANSAMRFNFLASELRHHFRVMCMDWVGRGMSGWMHDEQDYSLATYVEQIKQFINHLKCGPVFLLGSSLGGSASIEVAAHIPHLVSGLILNDVGPFIPKQRRKRRSETLSRHYVFRNPSEFLRKIANSQKNDGPNSFEINFYISYYQTKWSDVEGGRIYRHDVRAMQAYKIHASDSLFQWDLWGQIQCPVLVIHGMLSDALSKRTTNRMLKKDKVKVMRIPNTGHTPVLADANQIFYIIDWLKGSTTTANEWSVLHTEILEYGSL